MSEPAANPGSSGSPPRGRALVYGAPVALITLVSLGGVAFMPYLLARAPLLLVALSPIFRHLVLVAPSVDAWSLYAVAVPRHFAPDPFAYLLGREYGAVALQWIDANATGTSRLVRGMERLFAKVGFLALLVSPEIAVSTLAGVARVPWPVFVAANLAGTVGTVALARYVGGVFGGPIRAMVTFFDAHLWQVTVASVALVLALNWFSQRKGSPGPSEGE